MMAFVAFALGNWRMIALLAMIAAVPIAYETGRFVQSGRDDVATRIEDLQHANRALEAARQTTTMLVAEQRAATEVEANRRRIAEAERDDAETESRNTDAAIEAANAAIVEACRAMPSPPKEAAGPPASAKVIPACRGPFYDPDELIRMQRRYPAGPVRRAVNSAAPRGR